MPALTGDELLQHALVVGAADEREVDVHRLLELPSEAIGAALLGYPPSASSQRTSLWVCSRSLRGVPLSPPPTFATFGEMAPPWSFRKPRFEMT